MMFGSVVGWFRIAKSPHWLEKSCQELFRRVGHRVARVGADAAPVTSL